MTDEILKQNTSIQVCCLDCLKILTIYPEDVTDFSDDDEIKDYVCGLGWEKRYFEWRCPGCAKKNRAIKSEQKGISFLLD